jgi:hypothetical protein
MLFVSPLSVALKTKFTYFVGSLSDGFSRSTMARGLYKYPLPIHISNTVTSLEKVDLVEK